MKKLLLPAVAGALALLAPLATARADSQSYNFCTTGLSLNFCGSVIVSATAASGGGTDISFTVVNTTPNTQPAAVFTAIGINNAGLSSNATYSNLVVQQGGTTFTGWQVGTGTVNGPSGQLTVKALSSTVQDGLMNSVSAACSGTAQRIYTCGSGPQDPVTISFHTTDSNVTIGDGSTDLFVNAAAENGACVAGCGISSTTTTPEPATIALFATGLLGLGGPVSRFRRRRT